MSGYHQSPFAVEDDFVGKVGRTAYILPIYREMMNVDKTQAWSIFQKHIKFYSCQNKFIQNKKNLE